MDCGMPGFPGLHNFPECAQIHDRWVNDEIQSYNPLLSPFPPVFNSIQHQGLGFQCVGPSHQEAKLLELQLQHQSFQWIFRIDLFRIDWFDLLAVQPLSTPFSTWNQSIVPCLVLTGSWESLGLQVDQTSQSSKNSILNIHWKDWCWSWNSNILATGCKELTYLKDPDAGKDWRQEEKGTTVD